MKKLVTGQFNDSLSPIMDGVGVVVKNYAYWLNKKYGTGYCIGPQVPKFVDTDDYIIRFPTVPLPQHAPYRYGIPYTGSFRKKIDKIPFDIVHAHCPFVSGKEALRISKKLNIPLVTTFHSKYREDFLRAFHSELLADRAIKRIMRFYRKADMVWVPNNSTIDTLRSYGFTGHIEVAMNGTDLLAPSSREMEGLQAKGYALTETSPDDFILLFVGQHRWEKNVRLIIEGLHILQMKHKNFKAFFIGTGPEEKEMKALVSQYNLTDRVKFKGIIRNREVIKTYYAITDVFMFPSLYDNAPLVEREAAAFKVPTILSEGATAAEGVVDGENGFLFQNTVDSFAQKILSLIDKPNAVKKAGEGALATIYQPWEKIVDQVYERYVDIIASHR